MRRRSSSERSTRTFVRPFHAGSATIVIEESFSSHSFTEATHEHHRSHQYRPHDRRSGGDCRLHIYRPRCQLCVSPKGAGCFKTISAAVAAAAPHDVVLVSQGTYHEDVIVGKPLSLLGENAATVVIDATGLLNGINVDGH